MMRGGEGEALRSWELGIGSFQWGNRLGMKDWEFAMLGSLEEPMA